MFCKTFEELKGKAVAISIDGLLVREEAADYGRSPEYLQLDFSQSFEKIEGGVSVAIDIASLVGNSWPSNLMGKLVGATNVENAIEADIRGVRVRRLEGGPYGWKIVHSIAIEHFEKSRLRGITVDEYTPDLRSATISTTPTP